MQCLRTLCCFANYIAGTARILSSQILPGTKPGHDIILLLKVQSTLLDNAE